MSTLLTKKEYLQIVALLKMARDKDKETQNLTDALGKTIGDIDMAQDYVYGHPNRSAGELIEVMGFKAPNFNSEDL